MKKSFHERSVAMVRRWQCSSQLLYRLSIGIAALSLAAAVGRSAPGAASEPDWQGLQKKIESVDPAKPEALALLRDVVAELIRIQEAKSKELEALRAEVQALRAQIPVTTSTRGYRGATRSAPASASSAPSSSSPKPQPGNAVAAPTGLFGKVGLTKVHRADCQFGGRIKESDRRYFKSVQEAAAAGYEPCKVCKPEAVR
jgi:hypothetical protein